MDKADKDLERQYRKNLMVVASIVLIYSIAGGKMAADLSMFGAKLQFSRPDWLEYAMVAVMCFFWWRHWQVSGQTRTEHFNKAGSQINLPNCVLDYLFSNKEGDATFLLGDMEWCAAIPTRKYYEYPCPFVSYYISRSGIFEYGVAYAVFDDIDEKPSDGGYIYLSKIYHKIAIAIAVLISHAKCAIRIPAFGDAILPSIVFWVALLSWVFHSIPFPEPWQSEWCADLFNRL